MVHPGIIVASVFGVVVTGVVIYTILREEINDFLESFEKPSPVGYGFEQPRDQQQQQQRGQRGSGQDDHDFNQGRGQSSSMYQADYELRRRRSSQRPNEDENEDEDEKEPDHDVLMKRLRQINEMEQANAANGARLAEMDRAMRQREETIQRREQEFASIQRQQTPQSSEIYQPPFATNEPLIHNYSNNDDAQPSRPTSKPEVNSRTADAILRHNLSGNHQENVNPFEDPASLLDNASSSSVRSSVHGDDDMDAFADAEDRSMTVGHDDEDLDWTEAEIGSVGSHESDESWGSH